MFEKKLEKFSRFKFVLRQKDTPTELTRTRELVLILSLLFYRVKLYNKEQTGSVH